MINHDLIYENNKEWYLYLCWNPHRGLCGIMRMTFTVGLFYNIEYGGLWGAPEGRYCYHTMAEAVQDLIEWDGKDDPPGDWIKHKGLQEYEHPNSDNTFAIKKSHYEQSKNP